MMMVTLILMFLNMLIIIQRDYNITRLISGSLDAYDESKPL